MLDFLWGLKTVAAFDVWSFEHILSGLSIGHTVKKHNINHITKIYPKADHSHKSVIRFDILSILFLAFLWEAFEHYLEVGFAGNAVKYWFQGVEAFSNRMIADPILIVIGYYIAKKHPRFVIPARILSIIWLFFHIFIFPDSMYLQRVLGFQ